jgi:hypothetical protein
MALRLLHKDEARVMAEELELPEDFDIYDIFLHTGFSNPIQNERAHS